MNPTYEKSDFARIDCLLSPQIIYWESKNINFDNELKFDWNDQTLGENYLQKILIIKNRCPKARIAIDPQFEWNKDMAEQIAAKSSIQAVIKSLLEFNLKYETIGMVVSFRGQALVNDRFTGEFFEVIK